MNKVEILDNEDENNLKNVGSRIQKCRKAAGANSTSAFRHNRNIGKPYIKSRKRYTYT